MLELTNLNQHYRQAHILRDISLSVSKGSIVALLGRNGVGKTTLLKCVMGLLRTSSGNINYAQTDITSKPAEHRAGLGIGYVPQGRMIFPSLTVEENLMTGLGAGRTVGRKIPDSIYELFPVLKDMLSRKGGNLSGGQQQQLAIARALIIRPDLLILDEPTEGIQPSIVQEIAETLKQLNRQTGTTIWLVEQKLALVRNLADEYHILNRGEVAHGGSIDQLDDTVVDRYLTV